MLYNGHPALREEYLPRIRELYEEQQFNAPAAVQENAPDYEVGDHVVVDLPTQTIEGTVGYVGETDIRIDPENGYSWEHEVINKQQFDDGLRQDEPETEAPAQDEFLILLVAEFGCFVLIFMGTLIVDAAERFSGWVAGL